KGSPLANFLVTISKGDHKGSPLANLPGTISKGDRKGSPLPNLPGTISGQHLLLARPRRRTVHVEHSPSRAEDKQWYLCLQERTIDRSFVLKLWARPRVLVALRVP